MIEDALQEGYAKGLTKGLTEGHAEGRLEVLRGLLASGMPLESLSSSLNLSDDEVSALSAM